ncbi:hypothetical protein ACIRPK_16555 [Kitasatospora sp. NPDC101801]|uniref:hypothetical protein n=1 Tax=Kitasatospora sp. NPDC101801 TaxID=3364103 RepID=UPI0038237BB2
MVVEYAGRGDYDLLRPEVILSFHGLCLVKDDGELDGDGSVVCWACYGPDLAEAIRSL